MSEDLTKKFPQSDSERLALILSTVQALSVRVDNLEQTVKVRLYDTRPIWQKVLADAGKLEEGQRRLEDGQEALHSEVRAMRRDVYHRFAVLSSHVVGSQAELRDLNERVTKLESSTRPPNSQT